RRVSAAHRVKTAVVVFTVARDIQPEPSPTFAVLRRGEETIYDLCKSVGRLVGFERFDLFDGWRETDKIESRASKKRTAIGRLDRREPFLLEARQDKTINLIFWPMIVPDRGRRRRVQRQE